MRRREFLQKIGLGAVATATAAGGVLAAPPTLPPRSTFGRYEHVRFVESPQLSPDTYPVETRGRGDHMDDSLRYAVDARRSLPEVRDNARLGISCWEDVPIRIRDYQ